MKTLVKNLIKNLCHAEFISASQPLPEFIKLLPTFTEGYVRSTPHPVFSLSANAQKRKQTSPARGEVKKVAFTLAETLITLGIIGVVAALTIPSIIQSRTEKATVVKLKKTYSTLQHAFDMAIAEYGPVGEWVSSNDCHQVWDKITPYMPKIVKDCTGKRGSKCFGSTYITFDTKETFYQTLEWNTGCKAVFSDGTAINLSHIPWGGGLFIKEGKVMGIIDVDLNGSAKPNIADVDLFRFLLVDKGVLPAGDGYRFSQDAWPKNVTTWTEPMNRTAWVIYHENMDYRHCEDKLSWEGAHSCKDAGK